MSNLEPIKEKDLDLKHKFKVSTSESREGILSKKEAMTKKEVRQETVGEKEDAYAKILSKIHKHPKEKSSDDEIPQDAKNVLQKTDTESQIQNLIDIAMTKGVIHAVKVAKHLEDNYVLDMFHDRLLSDELHEALLKKGIIKDI